MSDTEMAKDYIKMMELFINHNLDNGYITKETTVEELLKLINNVKTNYIPMLEKMKNMYERK